MSQPEAKSGKYVKPRGKIRRFLQPKVKTGVNVKWKSIFYQLVSYLPLLVYLLLFCPPFIAALVCPRGKYFRGHDNSIGYQRYEQLKPQRKYAQLLKIIHLIAHNQVLDMDPPIPYKLDS